MQMDMFNGPPEQVENIARVYSKLAAHIVEFFRINGPLSEFHVDHLRRWISLRYPGTAPDSAGRIMRDLRQRGLIDYIVVNRRQSLYRITAVQDELK